jgi:hypothetical protein
MVVRVPEGIENLETVGEADGEGEARERNRTVERLPGYELHHDEGRRFVLNDLVDGADARMVKGGGGTRFAEQSVVRTARRVGQHLDRDVAMQAIVMRPVHHAHAASSDDTFDAVRAEPLTHHDAESR